MTRATMSGKHSYIEYSPAQLQVICDRLSVLEDKVEIKALDNKPNEIKKLWNDICISYSKVTTISPSRKKAINARLSGGYNIEKFERAFTICENSDFLKGKNDREWHATFDWMLNENNLTKVLDGNYGGLQANNKKHSYDIDKFEKLAINYK